MEKHLVHSDEEYLALFQRLEWSEVEILLGIEYALTDGRFHSDIAPEDEPDDLSVSETIYRKLPHALFHERYPCVVLLWIEDTFDRMGSVAFRVVEHVYEEGFTLSPRQKEQVP